MPTFEFDIGERVMIRSHDYPWLAQPIHGKVVDRHPIDEGYLIEIKGMPWPNTYMFFKTKDKICSLDKPKFKSGDRVKFTYNYKEEIGTIQYYISDWGHYNIEVFDETSWHDETIPAIDVFSRED